MTTSDQTHQSNQPDGNSSSNSEENETTFKFFLESVPPGKQTRILDLTYDGSAVYTNGLVTNKPDLYLYCADTECEGYRNFTLNNTRSLENITASPRDVFLRYTCKNCERTVKTFSLRIISDGYGECGTVYKFGEIPPFGPPTPPKIISLMREDLEHFSKGRRAENQGLGIAAFAYYRRVIENQKEKIFDEIIRVSEKVEPNSKIINELKAAKSEKQFIKAVDTIKAAIPQALLIDNHNPLTLLHDALSEGLHNESDKDCLKIATAIRVVLTDLVNKISEALKSEADLKSSVALLLNKKRRREEKNK